ncbi:hypothetical protein JI58_09805 [Marinosulfonomonas sp. PRT-SC04]|nr:hypothetical protein JI58_09805 [Marinosulfonomonas sp. PRT-SC04]
MRPYFVKPLILCAVLATVPFAPIAQTVPLPTAQTGVLQRLQALRLGGSNAAIINAACCKVCRKGKACGNSCIKRTYTCSKGVGCACNG